MPRQLIRHISIDISDYELIYRFMRSFTRARKSNDQDIIISTQHHSVYTMGPTSDKNDILSPNSKIPFIKTNRGGKITYHGPGQLIIYPLLDLKRLHIKPHQLISIIENTVIKLLDRFNIKATNDPNNRGIYIDHYKIASLGIRISRGCSYHGFSINLNTDLSFFNDINPCGLTNIKMINLNEIVKCDLSKITELCIEIFRLEISKITGQSIDIFQYSDKILEEYG